MPPDPASNVIPFEQRLQWVERYATTHGETISKHNNEIADLKTERAVQKERDKNLDERLERIEDAIAASAKLNTDRFNGIYKLGWWILTAFGGSFIALLANFLFKGGFVI